MQFKYKYVEEGVCMRVRVCMRACMCVCVKLQASLPGPFLLKVEGRFLETTAWSLYVFMFLCVFV